MVGEFVGSLGGNAARAAFERSEAGGEGIEKDFLEVSRLFIR